MGPRSIVLTLLAAAAISACATPSIPLDGAREETRLARPSAPRASDAVCQRDRAARFRLDQQRRRREREATARRMSSPRPESNGPITEPYSPPYWAIGVAALVLAAAWYLVRRKR